MAKAHADDAFELMRKKVIRTLDESRIDSILAHNFETSYLQEKYEKTIEWMNDDFTKTVNSIAIPPTMTAAQKKIIAEQWTNNLKLYIRGWSRENVVDLRDKIQKLAFAGQRSSSMIKLIQDNYGVGEAKAKFLARQETSLLLSKFREERYKDVGIQKYKWQTAHDGDRVRHDHQLLDGKIYFFSSPPIVDRKTGRRANPGEDFGCRCVARPIWD
jgi:SPP1 gp7 family putative phage head morphogenesis protein